MREYHITLLQEKLDSLAEGKEICLFEYGKTFKLFVKTDKVEEDKVLDSDVFLDEIEEQLGSDRFDGEYNQECWDYDDVRNSIIDTTLSLKVGDKVSKDYLRFVVEYSQDSFTFNNNILVYEEDIVLNFDEVEDSVFEIIDRKVYKV